MRNAGRAFEAERAPGNEREQAGLHGQAQQQRPIGNGEQVGALQHVDVGRRHCDRQSKEADAGAAARGPPQQAGRSQQFEDAAHQHHGARPGNGGRHDAHFDVGGDEMGDASDQKPQEHERQAGAPPAASRAG